VTVGRIEKDYQSYIVPGVLVRASTAADREALVTLAAEVLDRDDPHPVHAHWTTRLLAGEGPGLEADDVVVADHPRHGVVGMAWLLGQPLLVRGVPVPAGQVEQLAVDPGHRGRGVARALLAAVHERAKALGHLLTVVRGVPWLYDRLGYSPLFELPRVQEVCGDVVGSPDGAGRRRYQLLPAAVGDAGRIAAWDAVDDGWAVRRPRDEEAWRVELARDGGHPWRTRLHLCLDAAGEAGGVVGVREGVGGSGVVHRVLVAPGGCPRALLRAALHAAAVDGRTRLSLPSRHRVRAAAPELPAPGPSRSWRARVPDLVALIRAVAGPAAAALRASPLDGWRGDVTVDHGVGPATLITVDARGELGVDGTPAVARPGASLPHHVLAAVVLGHRDIDAAEAGDGAVMIDDPAGRALFRAAYPAGGCDLWPLS